MVHHIKPISERPDLQYEESNLLAMNKSCHERHHAEKGERW